MRTLVVAGLAAAALALSPAAGAQAACSPLTATEVSVSDAVPPGFAISSRRAVAIARDTDAASDVAADRVVVRHECGTWRLNFTHGDRLDAQVIVDGRTGRVLEEYAGFQARWMLARGSATLFVGKGMPLIVVLLALVSVAPFFDRRRLWRPAHLDLAALLALGISLIPYRYGDMYVATPLVCAAMVLLLVRLVLLVRRPAARAGEQLVMRGSPRVLLATAGVLVAARAVYNVAVAHVSDVGYLSVFGAQAILDGFPVYAEGAIDLDTYGPATHFAYVPLTALFPLPGGVARGDNAAAHATAIAFDVLTALALYALGRRLRAGRSGHALGAVLAFAWAANPIGFYAMAVSANDGLVGLLVVVALLALGSPVGRGVAAALAATAKWVPVVLLPLFAAGRGPLRSRDAAISGLAALAAAAAVTLAVLPDGGIREIYEVSLGGLAALDSPFTIWGLWDLPEVLRNIALAAALAFAGSTGFVPRERPAVVVAALAAAVILAVQLALPYWSYTYPAWYVPAALVAFFAAYGAARETRA